MNSDPKQRISRWHSVYNERQKLQHTYLAVAVISFVAAAVISLLNERLGHDILIVTGLALATFLANAVIWSIIYSSLLSDLKTPRKNNR